MLPESITKLGLNRTIDIGGNPLVDNPTFKTRVILENLKKKCEILIG